MNLGGPELLILVILPLWLGAAVWWIVSIVEVARTSEAAYRATGREKITWVLVVVLVGVIGTLIWWFGPRREVLAADRAGGWSGPAGSVPAPPSGPPAGWYPNPSGETAQRYWDGHRWTEHLA